MKIIGATMIDGVLCFYFRNEFNSQYVGAGIFNCVCIAGEHAEAIVEAINKGVDKQDWPEHIK